MAAAALLPWHRSGRIRRNGFALARVAHGLGLVDDGPRRVLFVLVFLLPLLAALTFAAAVAGWWRASGALACATGAVGLASAFVVFRTIRFGQPGPLVATVAAIAALVLGARLALGRNPADV